MTHKKFLFGFLLILVFVLAVVVQPSQTSYAAGTVPTRKPSKTAGSNNNPIPSSTNAGDVSTPFNATVISVKTLTPTGGQGQGAAVSSKKATKTKVPTRTKTPTRTETPTITNTPNPATATNTNTGSGIVSSTPTPTFTPTFTPVSGIPNALSIIPIEYIKYIYMFCGVLIILAIILIIFLILRRGKQQNIATPPPPPDASSPSQ